MPGSDPASEPVAPVDLDGLCALVAAYAGREVHPEDRLMGDLQLDSLDLMEILLAVSEYSDRVLPEQFDLCDVTVKDLHHYLLGC
jgi:acyl carrier protein